MSKHTNTNELITAAKDAVSCFDAQMIERIYFGIGAAGAYTIASAIQKLANAIAKAEGGGHDL